MARIWAKEEQTSREYRDDRQNNAPPSPCQRCASPNTQNHGYFTLRGKRYFADVIKLRVFRWGRYGLSNVITRALKERGRRVRVRENVTKKQRSKWYFMSQGMETASNSWRRQESYPPLESLEGMQPCLHLDLSPLRPVLDFWPRELE